MENFSKCQFLGKKQKVKSDSDLNAGFAKKIFESNQICYHRSCVLLQMLMASSPASAWPTVMFLLCVEDFYKLYLTFFSLHIFEELTIKKVTARSL